MSAVTWLFQSGKVLKKCMCLFFFHIKRNKFKGITKSLADLTRYLLDTRVFSFLVGLEFLYCNVLNQEPQFCFFAYKSRHKCNQLKSNEFCCSICTLIILSVKFSMPQTSKCSNKWHEIAPSKWKPNVTHLIYMNLSLKCKLPKTT